MGIVSAIILFGFLWFLTFLTVIPIKLETQGDVGEVVHGTHAGAPENHHLKKKAYITTGITVVLWGIVYWTVTSGNLTVRDIDIFNRFEATLIDETNG
jgi:predicted secreted protein